MAGQRQYINQMQPGETIDQVFLVAEKDLRTTRTGDLYVTCTLADRTGRLSARMWQATEAIFAGIPAGGFIHVKGRTEEYRGALQMVIDALRPYAADKVDLSEFQAVTELDVEAMWSEMLEILRAIKNKPLQQLIKKFVEDRELIAAFKKSPAAMNVHHPFIGGLLEHTLNVAKAAQALLPMYPKLNADLVLAAVFLHDIGKSAELTTGPAINYTDRGQLVGHITIAAIWVQEKADLLAEELGEAFPQKTLDLLQHIILSHHGLHEYGSPKLPMVPEAYFLHYLDNLDAKMFTTAHQIANDPNSESTFTPWQSQLSTRLFKGSGDLEG